MYSRTRILFIYAEAPLHPGSGAASSAAIDLPVQRERITRFPLIQSSGVKGALRRYIEGQARGDERIDRAFGPQPKPGEEPSGAGEIALTDASVLAYPVRSVQDVFVWVTCALALERFARNTSASGLRPPLPAQFPSADAEALVSSADLLLGGADVDLVLEEYALRATYDAEVAALAEWIAARGVTDQEAFARRLRRRLVVVSDQLFTTFVTQATEVVTRIKVDESGIAEHGALWTEELVPSETILYCTVHGPARNGERDALDFVAGQLRGKRLQIGGDAGVGRGLVYVNCVGGEA